MYIKKRNTISEVNLQTLTNLPNTLIEEETQAFDTVARYFMLFRIDVSFDLWALG